MVSQNDSISPRSRIRGPFVKPIKGHRFLSGFQLTSSIPKTPIVHVRKEIKAHKESFRNKAVVLKRMNSLENTIVRLSELGESYSTTTGSKRKAVLARMISGERRTAKRQLKSLNYLCKSKEIYKARLQTLTTRVRFFENHFKGKNDTAITLSNAKTILSPQEFLENMQSLQNPDDNVRYLECQAIRSIFQEGSGTKQLAQTYVDSMCKIESIEKKRFLLTLFIKEVYGGVQNEFPDWNLLKQATAWDKREFSYAGFHCSAAHNYFDNEFKNNPLFQTENTVAAFKGFSKSSPQSSMPFHLKASDSLINQVFNKTVSVRVFGKESNSLERYMHQFRCLTPKLMLLLPGLKPEQQAHFDQELSSILKKRGLLCSSGNIIMGRVDRFNKRLAVIADKVADRLFKPLLASKYKESDAYKAYVKSIPKITTLYQLYLDAISGYSSFNAMAITCKFLRPHKYALPADEIKPIKLMLRQGLQVHAEVSKLKGKSPHIISSACEKMAAKIVDNVFKHNRPALLHIGSPIRPGNSGSKHAMYLVLKPIKGQGIRPIFVNGGDQSNIFNTVVDRLKSGDVGYTHFTSFRSVTQHNKKALVTYVANALAMRLRYAVEVKEGETSEQTMAHRFSSLYLADTEGNINNTFKYKGKKITGLERDDLEEVYPCQSQGNCTVHNLKYAIVAAMGLSELGFGKLVDSCYYGIHKVSKPS